MKRFRALIEDHYVIFAYLFFGVMTTVVNYLVYLSCFNLLHISAAVSNITAWVAAVIFAYLTNKPFVFHSFDWSVKTVLPELGKFVSSRVVSGALETIIIYVSVDILMMNGKVMKLIMSVFVVIVNYVASKLLVFREKEEF